MQSECDPHLWSQIENMVRQRLSPLPQRLPKIHRSRLSRPVAQPYRSDLDSKILSISRVAPTNAATATSAPSPSFFHWIQTLRIYDLEIVESHRFFSRNFFATCSHQFRRIALPRFP